MVESTQIIISVFMTTLIVLMCLGIICGSSKTEKAEYTVSKSKTKCPNSYKNLIIKKDEDEFNRLKNMGLHQYMEEYADWDNELYHNRKKIKEADAKIVELDKMLADTQPHEKEKIDAIEKCRIDTMLEKTSAKGAAEVKYVTKLESIEKSIAELKANL